MNLVSGSFDVLGTWTTDVNKNVSRTLSSWRLYSGVKAQQSINKEIKTIADCDWCKQGNNRDTVIEHKM